MYTIFEVIGYESYSPQGIPNGWAKLYRDILDESWFKKPDVFYVYLSLLVKLYNEEAVISYKKLCKENVISSDKVYKSLQYLKKCGVISFQKKPHHDTVKVCLLGHSGEAQQPKNDQITTKEQPKNDQRENKIELKSQANIDFVTNDMSVAYAIQNDDNDQRTTKEQPKIELNYSQNFDKSSQVFENSTSIYNNKEKEREESVYNTRTHEFFAETLKSDMQWKERVCKYFSSLDFARLTALIDKFVDYLEITDERHKTLPKFKNHFFHWLRKEIENNTIKQTSSAKAVSNRCSTELPSSGWVAKPSTKEELEQKDARERLRLQRFIEISKDKSNPSAKSCIFELTDKYNDGTLKRLGIDWKPPE